MIALWVALFGFVVATAAAAMALVFLFELTGAEWWRPFERLLVRLARGAVLAPLLVLPRLTWPSALASFALAALAVGLRPARRAPALGLIVLAFALTIAAWDALMIREPGWVSDLYGLYVFASGLTSALALVAMASSRATANAEHLHALGRLLLCAILVWAYLAFFQLLLVWLPDLPREVSFYRRRVDGPWAIVTASLALGHFVIPFFVLLFRRAKRSPRVLAAVGTVVFAAGALDFVWLVKP